MTSKDDSPSVAVVDPKEKSAREKVFKSPGSKFGPLQPLQNMGKTVRGSFIARGEASLGKIAQFNKVKEDAVGTGAKGTNFVFAPVSPPKEVQQTETRAKQQQPPSKKQRVS